MSKYTDERFKAVRERHSAHAAMGQDSGGHGFMKKITRLAAAQQALDSIDAAHKADKKAKKS